MARIVSSHSGRRTSDPPAGPEFSVLAVSVLGCSPPSHKLTGSTIDPRFGSSSSPNTRP
ncbi:hypothetical protein BD309DRAFT_952570 [Dichomitus squalens]|uniref:Uncharacterized protein n=1 Tax=Dichomitus squalens TaxID=114155 RepID=A0A4Q9P0U7_9APHY|nr:hypothetical protein BD311DRAFT_767628 [Dichomitus squalens]TBU47095.1 hypothetical protein BD309DRAFT_952570 [Dichomitus squalens]